MLTVDLLRHGALKGGIRYRGRVDDPLTAEGRRAMDQVWQKIAGEVDLIVSSPMRRCLAPASEWASASGIRCLSEPRVSELDYGAWEGLTLEEIHRRDPGMLERWRNDPTGMRPPEGESPEELLERVSNWWDEAMVCFEGAHLLLVAHSGSLRMLLAHVLRAPIESTRRLAMPYACWSRICADHGHAWLEFHHRRAVV